MEIEILNKIENNNEPQQINKAIIEDVELQRLYNKIIEIYSKTLPTIIYENNKSKIIWNNENNESLIKNIKNLIKLRTLQIINHYI